MQNFKLHTPKPEILFITGSTADRRGRRILVRCDGTENTIFQEDLDSEALKLIGIEGKDLDIIRGFLMGR